MSKKILLICLKKIGDVTLSSIVADYIKKLNKDIQVGMLVKAPCHELCENNHNIDYVFTLNYNTHGISRQKIADTLKIVKKIKPFCFDKAIILDEKDISYVIAKLSKIKSIVGISDRPNRFPSKLLMSEFIKMNRSDKYTLQWQFWKNFCTTYFKKDISCSPYIGTAKTSDQEYINKLLSQNHVTRPFITFCIKGSTPQQNWPIEKFGMLLTQLHSLNRQYQFIITGHINDFSYVANLKNYTDTDFINFCGQTNLLQLQYLISKSVLLVTVDTGTAHIAGTTDTPIIALYKYSSLNYIPYSKHITPITCMDSYTPQKDPLSLYNIPVNIVLDACIKELNMGIEKTARQSILLT